MLHAVESEKELQHALAIAVEQESQLLFQCDVELSTRRCILQTLYLIDAVLHDHAEADLLRRSSSDLFSLHFSDRWDAVFVDVIDEHEAEIDLRRLSSLTLVKVLEDNELDMCQALRRCFCRSILRVQYPCRHTDDCIRNQIELLDQVICDEPRFVSPFKNFCLHVINQRSSIRAHVNSIWNVLGLTRIIGSLFHTYQTAFDLIAEQLFGLLLVYIEESSCLASHSARIFTKRCHSMPSRSRGIYVGIWKHDLVMDAVFDVIRLVQLEDWHQRLSSG